MGPIRFAIVATLVAASAVPASVPASAQEPRPTFTHCYEPSDPPELYGPTDINAQTANGRVAVAVNREGTVSVLTWPRPSFYDQVKYHSWSRSEPRLGVAPNAGIFLGVVVDGATTWLRDLPATQRYVDPHSDAIGTTFHGEGFEVTVTDVVPPDRDVLVRSVEATRPLTLVAFENLNLVVSKRERLPTQDWCEEEQNTDAATYDADLDAIVHEKAGTDESTGQPSSVAIAVGFAGRSTGHQVGGDADETPSLPAAGPNADAYVDAADGELSGNGATVGHTTGALTTEVGPGRPAALFVAGGADAEEAAAALTAARERPVAGHLAAKRAWFDRLLADAPMPATDDAAVTAVARRALLTLVSVYDPRSGAIVASIARQSPYGEDWVRDGAFFNHVLDRIGRSDWVAKRLRWYAALQERPDPLVPPGNWAMNYYADGVPGGPIPWEIDETGYGLWAFWDHTEATGDLGTLRDVYPAVRRSADFLVSCTDPRNGLQCLANEDDNPQPTQTIVGAGPVWLGLDSAVRAAEALGEPGDAERWAARRDELGAAIDEHLYAEGAYGGGDPVIVWPVRFKAYDDERFATHYDAVWARIAPTFAGERERGQYELKGLLSLAHARGHDSDWLARVREGIRWVATEHATTDTAIMGEAWKRVDGEIISVVSQPHVWEQVLFYLAALEAWPPAGAPGPAPPPPVPDRPETPVTGGGAALAAVLTLLAAARVRSATRTPSP